MEQQAGADTKPQEGSTVSVVVVPGHLRQQVLDYVESLTDDGSDVGGYMLNTAGIRPGSMLMAKSSNTNCTFWDTKGPAGGVDFTCTD